MTMLVLDVAAVASASFAKDREVKVYNWSDYIDESILADFTKETGIKVDDAQLDKTLQRIADENKLKLPEILVYFIR